jgi:hypothetical protein
MQWKRTFELLLPALFTKHVPEALNFAPLSDVVLSKRVWNVSMDKQLGYQVTFADKVSLEVDSDSQSYRLSLEKDKECFSDDSDLSAAMMEIPLMLNRLICLVTMFLLCQHLKREADCERIRTSPLLRSFRKEVELGRCLL